MSTVPIGSLEPNPWNPNRQSDFIYERELASIKEHGFLDPVLVRTVGHTLQIVDGEHRWKAATQLGFTEIAINNLGEIPDDVAKRLTIILNEVKGKPDDQALAKLMADLAQNIDISILAKTLPYTEDELKHLIADSKIDWDAVQPGMDNTTPTPDPEEGWVNFSVKLPEAVQVKLKGQLERFKRLFVPDEKRQEMTDAQAIEIMVTRVESAPDTAFQGLQNN